MANVYKKQKAKPLPTGATLSIKAGRLYASWRDSKGRKQTAPLSKDGTKILVESATYSAKFRTADGRVMDVTTGCRDKSAAHAKLAEMVRQEELVRGGVLSAAEMRASRASDHAIATHFTAYLTHLKSKGDSQRHISSTKRSAECLIQDCQWERLIDIDTDAIETWLVNREAEGMGARTRNSYVLALNGFCQWCLKSKRLAVNPVAAIRRANERSDRRRTRRALSVEEMERLLYVARVRPLAEKGRATISRPSDEMPANRRSRATWTKAPLTFDGLDEATRRAKASLNAALVAKLEREGWERSLVYRMALFTGLRRGELASLTMCSLNLACGFVTVDAASEKARRGATIPLHGELLEELKQWVEAERPKQDDKLFCVPDKLIKRLDKDLALAGIPKKDDRGRTLDVHALRHSFGTMLSTSGVAPRIAQAAMRHSSIELTMQLYTDPRLLDVAGAMSQLPSLNANS